MMAGRPPRPLGTGPTALHPPADHALLRAAALGRGRVGVAAGHQPPATPAGRAPGHRLPGTLPPAHPGRVVWRVVRAEHYLHLADQQARQARVARRAPKPGQRGSRRWRRLRARQRQLEARYRRRVRQTQHQAAKQVVAFAVRQRVGTLLIGDPKGITDQRSGRVQNLRVRRWCRTYLVQALRDKAELAGIAVRLVDERGTSSTCPCCRRRLSSTVGPASCRYGVTNVVTFMMGGVGPAWPRATRTSLMARLGVARRTRGGTLPPARIKQRHPPGSI